MSEQLNFRFRDVFLKFSFGYLFCDLISCCSLFIVKLYLALLTKNCSRQFNWYHNSKVQFFSFYFPFLLIPLLIYVYQCMDLVSGSASANMKIGKWKRCTTEWVFNSLLPSYSELWMMMKFFLLIYFVSHGAFEIEWKKASQK